MAARKAILFEHDTLLIRPEQDQLLENLVHMVNISNILNIFFFCLKLYFYLGCLSTKYIGIIKTLSN